MENVELFGYAQSTYVRTARLVCEEKGIVYSLVPLEFGEDSHRRMHPHLKMPAFRSGEVQLFETLAIAIYLNEQFPGPDLHADTALGRARMFQWISAANDYVYHDVVVPIAKSGSIDRELSDKLIPVLRPFDHALANQPYLTGNRLTLADLFLLPMWLYTQSVAETADCLSPLPNLAAWAHTLQERPSVERTKS